MACYYVLESIIIPEAQKECNRLLTNQYNNSSSAWGAKYTLLVSCTLCKYDTLHVDQHIVHAEEAAAHTHALPQSHTHTRFR